MSVKWYQIALGEVGQHELKKGENKRIIEYHSLTSLKATKDEVPWCSSFANWCCIKAGIPGTGSAAAASWLKWGIPLKTPREGCIVVLQQSKHYSPGTDTHTGYHVGFFAGMGSRSISLLGGNQSDSVKISSFSLDSWVVRGYRWPSEVK